MNLHRKFYNKMLEWKKGNGKSALLIEGARRIGKSTIAELFAQNEYEDYLLLDFSEEEEDVLENFKNIGKPDKFFQNLFMLKGKELPPRKSVIIFDEVQLFPKARQAIKKLVKDGRYDYIETGSLISIKKNVKDILIPSEEHLLKMYPLDFEEFLESTGNSVAYRNIKEAFENRIPLNDAIHRRMMELFRTYMAVGGMPQAVVAYIEGKSYAEIDSIKQDILTLYENDLKKYDSENREKASVVFKVIPEQLAKRNAIFKFSLIDKNARYRNYVDAVDFVAESMIGNICINVTEPDMAMELNADRSNFKLYLGDTGLFVTQMMKMENKENLYRSIIFDKISTNLGILYENMVAQMLTVAGHNLYFHEFMYQPENQVQEKKYEIDFLLTPKKRIVPVEVKSSDYRQHKSIDYLKQKYPQLKLRDKFIVYTKNLEVKDGFTYLPVYMAGLI
ncbi:MAG: AAA family ATPase [Fibrobacter sp.]|nr:AAA family ATPase [Fibrobacter sp.]